MLFHEGLQARPVLRRGMPSLPVELGGQLLAVARQVQRREAPRMLLLSHPPVLVGTDVVVVDDLGDRRVWQPASLLHAGCELTCRIVELPAAETGAVAPCAPVADHQRR